MMTLVRATEDFVHTRSYLIEDDDNSYGTSFAYIQYFDTNNTLMNSIALVNDSNTLDMIEDEAIKTKFNDYIASIPPEDIVIESSLVPPVDEFPDEVIVEEENPPV